MKTLLRRLFNPVLSPFERGDEPFSYKPLNRKILIFVSAVFLALATLVCYLIPAEADPGYYIPVIVFGCVGGVGLIVGALGNERAVAKIWNNK
ncbi:hypothetical protein ACFOEK_11835 [Litoribrevibacter euphylliae]|uniref:Uncharacterized protein n=1 Tax=Litoribrevibacter euphylliae TaxID=1834034 RepID=A0ABV7HG74_9GAMM